MTKIDREVVRRALPIWGFLEAYGYSGTKSSDGYRYNDCPSCGDGCRGKFKANAEVCICHSCGFSGDLFAVAGAVLDLSSENFGKIVDTCAEVAGIEGDYNKSEYETRRQEFQQRQEQEARRRAQERENAERGAAEIWRTLKTRSQAGQEYVASRGVLPQHAGRECKYTSRSVCLPLWRDGEVVNIVGRRFDGWTKPKIRGLDRCGTRGTFGKPVLNSSHQGPIVVVEGFFDYLSARQLSPTRLVLGAHGCTNLPYVAEIAARLACGAGAGLVLVSHRDAAGQKHAEKAKAAAVDAGMSPSAMTDFVVAEGCNDLNDHLCASGRRVA